jgi:PadR family transcriptional regulator PadR
VNGVDLTDVEGAGLPRNYLRPCLLLLIAEAPSHGYDLLERLGELGLPAADPGGLYRALRALERERLVTSHWETSGAGPARRTYVITDEGTEWLHAWAGALAEGRRMVGLFLQRYARSVRSRRPEPDRG